MAMSALALSQAKNIGKSARRTVDTGRNLVKGLENLHTNVKIDRLAMKNYMASENDDKTYEQYREEASEQVHNQEADKLKQSRLFKISDSEFNDKVKDETKK